ncbi:succinate dehydrogenase, hydrophobic membrane anchor protein [Propionivibrio sp.]|uniref:succinate dehydrogenase, hydrophobic membrane anchor protein n=1 Tax=Propionivibrio sp. TaxID=2212460 RepID=UPI003BF2BD93
MVNRILVGAHYGLKDWVIQRATAIIMALYSVIFFVDVLVVGPNSFEAWSRIFATGFMKFATFLFFLSLFYHAWIGIRDIWMDYIKPDGLRLLLMIATAAALVGYAGWAVQILYSVDLWREFK